MAKFPKLIHVIEEGEGDGKYFEVHTDGVASMEDHVKDVAIYQLVKVGKLNIQKRFIDKPQRRTR